MDGECPVCLEECPADAVCMPPPPPTAVARESERSGASEEWSEEGRESAESGTSGESGEFGESGESGARFCTTPKISGLSGPQSMHSTCAHVSRICATIGDRQTVVMPCGHHAHARCTLRLLLESVAVPPTCPVCRAPLVRSASTRDGCHRTDPADADTRRAARWFRWTEDCEADPCTAICVCGSLSVIAIIVGCVS